MKVADFGGLDTFYHISEYLNADLCDSKKPMKLIEDLYEAGHYGVKTGQGFYDYSGDQASEAVRIRNQKYADVKKCMDQWK